MAEIVAFGASVAAFIQLTDRVVSLSKFYLEALDDCPHDIKTILIEITSLKALLEVLNFLIAVKPAAGDAPSLLSRLAGQDGPIESCRKAVEMLEKQLPSQARTPAQKRRKTEDLLKLLAWPLRQSKATKLLAEISRYKEIIALAITTDSSKDLKDIKANLSAIRQTLTEKQHQDFCKWLEHTNPTRRHNDSYELHEEHTGAWMTRYPDWNAWVQGLRRFVWIHGIPGAGKTVLTSFLVEEAKRACQKNRQAVIFYYCHFVRNQDEAKPLLRWLIGQLCRQSRTVPQEIMSLFEINHEPNLTQLLNALESSLLEFDRVYFVIDAVDESFPRDTLLRVIRDLATDERYQKIRLLGTSRQYIDIETTFAPIAGIVPMDNELVGEDVKIFVHSTLQSCSEFADWPKDLLAEVEDALVAGTKGMFRWAFCQIDALRWLRPHEAKKAIRSLPKTLDETYERIFQSIRDEEWKVVHTTLSLIYAHGTLGIMSCGLVPAVLLELLAPLQDGSGIDSAYQSLSLAHLRRVSGCLLTVSTDEEGLEVVEFSHYTVKEYLLSDRMAQGPVSRFSLTEPAARRQYCRRALLIACQAQGWDESYARNDVENPGPFCVTLAIQGLLRVCEADAQQDHHLRYLYRTLLDPSRPSWEMLKLLESGSYTSFTLILYMEPPENLDAALFANFISAGLFELAKHLLQSHNINDILYQTPIHTQITDAATWVSTVMDFFRAWPHSSMGYLEEDINLFEEIIIIVADLERPTEAFYNYLAFHEHYVCSRSLANPAPLVDNECRIDVFMRRLRADPDGVGYQLTPLQIAIYRLDSVAVEELLGVSASVNGVGDEDGIAVLDGCFDMIPANMSPLALVRNLRNLGVDVDASAELTEAAERIEEILLKWGAVEDVDREMEEDDTSSEEDRDEEE